MNQTLPVPVICKGAPMTPQDLLVVYDFQCSICDAYCRRVHVRPAAGRLLRVNAREANPAMQEVTARGLDIDQGLVLKVGDTLYYGSDAIHQLARLGNPGDPFNWLAYWTFRSRSLSHLIYPVLQIGHNLVLKILGSSKVNNLRRPGNERF